MHIVRLIFSICVILNLIHLYSSDIISSSNIEMCTANETIDNVTGLECEKKIVIALTVNNNEVSLLLI